LPSPQSRHTAPGGSRRRRRWLRRGEAAARRGQTVADRKQAIREWERQFGKIVDLTIFEREILPLIQEVPLSRLVKATGLSLRYCSQIRRGEKVPHPRHWLALRNASRGLQ